MKTPSDRQLRILRLLVAGVKLEPSDSTTKYELTITSSTVTPATLADMQSNGWLIRDAQGRWSVTDAGYMQAGVADHVKDYMREVRS